MMRAANNAAIRSAIGLGQTDAPTFLAQSLTGQSLTGTQATSLVDLAATWNTSGTPTAIKLNVTDTASNAASPLMDLRVGGVSKFAVGKNGDILGNSLTVAGSTVVSVNGIYGAPLGWPASPPWGGIQQLNMYSGSPTTGFIQWNNELFLFRDAAGILSQRNGVLAQAFRAYNTFTDPSNKEWGEFDWKTTTNTLRIGTNHIGTGQARPIDFVTGGAVRMSILAGGGLDVTGDLRGGATVRCGAASGIGVEGRFFIKSPADGIGTLTDWAQSNFNRLQLGSTTDSFPAIARDGAGIKFTGAAAGSTSWIKVPAVAVASLPAAATAGVGARSFVSDALSPVFGSAVTAGGSATVPVYSTGSAWNVG
jgi:hypothetical protein